VRLRLQVRSDRRGSPYRTIAMIEVDAELEHDPHKLRFDPFHSARGLVPAGFVHHLRVASYAASRWARDAANGVRR
jgi:hypothetical protein